MKLLRRMIMTNPTRQELYDYCDDLLPDDRRKTIERLALQDKELAKAIALIQRIDSTMRSDKILEHTSDRFTTDLMNEILPQHESILLRILKNSSNVFAMAVVLFLIVIAFMVIPGHTTASTSMLNQSLDSFTTIFQSSSKLYSQNMKEYVQPVFSFVSKGLGNIFILGLGVMLGLGFLDDLFRKKFFRS